MLRQQEQFDTTIRVEDTARELHRLYAKQTEPRPTKWQHIKPEQRSLWRLIARKALTLKCASTEQRHPAR